MVTDRDFLVFDFAALAFCVYKDTVSFTKISAIFSFVILFELFFLKGGMTGSSYTDIFLSCKCVVDFNFSRV